jgi:hypothetical protein
VLYEGEQRRPRNRISVLRKCLEDGEREFGGNM